MYEIIENPVVKTWEEVKELYQGKWVYIVKSVFNETDKFLHGIPVIMGDMPCPLIEEGFYDKYNTLEYEERYILDLRPYYGFGAMLQEVLREQEKQNNGN